MDRFCTFIIIIGAVVLLVMGFGELTKMHAYRRSQTTCGMQARTNSPRSAKVTQKLTNALESDDMWPGEILEKTDEVKEKDPNEEIMRESFEWSADASETEKYNVKGLKDGLKHKTNIRTAQFMTEIPEVLNTRVIGTPNTMLKIFHKQCGEDAGVKFSNSESSVCFNGTDQYVTARQKVVGRQ